MPGFYETVFKEKTTDLRTQKMFLNNFSNKLKSSHHAELITQLNQEVENAVTNTKAGKTPGPDGLSIEF